MSLLIFQSINSDEVVPEGTPDCIQCDVKFECDSWRTKFKANCADPEFINENVIYLKIKG